MHVLHTVDIMPSYKLEHNSASLLVSPHSLVVWNEAKECIGGGGGTGCCLPYLLLEDNPGSEVIDTVFETVLCNIIVDRHKVLELWQCKDKVHATC